VSSSHLQNVTVYPCASVSGEVTVPGDKSISHRAAMMASLSSGYSTIQGFLASEDCLSTLRVMGALGARLISRDEDGLCVQGTAGRLIQPAGVLDAGNSGTTIRLGAGLISGHSIQVEMTGDESLRSRPMKRIQEPLQRMGAVVELLGEGGRPPVRIRGGALRGIRYELPVASAQVKSCVLLAGLFAGGVTTVIEPRPTRDHTERMFAGLGIPVRVEGLEISLEGFGEKGPQLEGRTFRVPGDFSSAAFLILLAAGKPGSDLTLRGVGLNPRRTAFIDVLTRMGANIRTKIRKSDPLDEPIGTVVVRGGELTGTEVGGGEIPNLIDELPLVSVAGALAGGQTVLRDAEELRVKESDRIHSMVANLQVLGVDVQETPDGMVIQGGNPLRQTGPVRSFGDHRVAMAMAVLGTYAENPLGILNVACTETSYPGFWSQLEELGVHVE